MTSPIEKARLQHFKDHAKNYSKEDINNFWKTDKKYIDIAIKGERERILKQCHKFLERRGI